MALTVIASPPSRSRPPFHPPPRKFPLLGSLFPFEPLEPSDPPDPPDVSLVLALLRLIFAMPSCSSQAPSKTLDLELLIYSQTNQSRSVGVTLVPVGDIHVVYSSFIYCSMQFVSSPACRVAPLGLCPNSPSLLPLSIPQVCSRSSTLYVYSFIEWYRELMEWIALDLWILAFHCDVPIDLVSLGSVMLFSSTYVVLMRPSTAVCSHVLVFNLGALGAVSMCSPWCASAVLYSSTLVIFESMFVQLWKLDGLMTHISTRPVVRVLLDVYGPRSFSLERVSLLTSSSTLSGLDAERGSLMLKIRVTSSFEVLIKGYLAMLKIVNCALVAVSISGCLSLIVVSQDFISLSNNEFRGFLYDISCL